MKHLLGLTKSEIGCTEATCTCGWFVYGRDTQAIVKQAIEHLREHRTVEMEG